MTYHNRGGRRNTLDLTSLNCLGDSSKEWG